MFENQSTLLEKAIAQFNNKPSTEMMEDVEGQRADELMDYYQDTMQKREGFVIVFNRMKADGTLLCVGKYVTIVMNPDKNNSTYIAKLNTAYKVVVTEIDLREKVVYVKPMPVNAVQDQSKIKGEIIKILDRVTDEVKKFSEAEIESAKDHAYNRYCSGLSTDSESDMEKMDSILDVAESRAIASIIENLAGNAMEKAENGLELSPLEKDVCSLILPAKIFAIRSKDMINVKGVVDILGKRLEGIIRAQNWTDTFTDDEALVRELNDHIGTSINVIIVGYDKRHDCFECSRKNVSPSAWDDIEKYVNVGDIINVRCTHMGDQVYYGRLIGENGNSVEELQDVTLTCDYPQSNNAIRFGLNVELGGIYQCKVRKVIKERKKIYCKTIRGARWAHRDGSKQ